MRLDAASIPFADRTFDIIFCSHVLEHLPDDRAALREFRRLLKPSGWTVLLVPMYGQETIEDPLVVGAADRARVFGQSDHVRRYGLDFADRVRAAGFDVDLYSARDVAPRSLARLGIRVSEWPVVYCRPTGGAA